MKILRDSTLKKMVLDAYTYGCRIGYDHAWQMRVIEDRNRGLILGDSKIERELEEIFKNYGRASQ